LADSAVQPEVLVLTCAVGVVRHHPAVQPVFEIVPELVMPDEFTVKTSRPPEVIVVVPPTGEYNPVFVELPKVSEGVAVVPAPSANPAGEV
jgi:hypothetical protein